MTENAEIGARETQSTDYVEGILRSRFFALTENERKVLQIASLIGDYFWVELIESIFNKQIKDKIASLVKKGFLEANTESLIIDCTAYGFTNPAFRLWLSQQPLDLDHAGLHRLIADWLVIRIESLPLHFYPLLADHLVFAGDIRNAVEVIMRAGHRAFDESDTVKALEFFNRAIAIAEKAADLTETYAQCLVRRADLLRHLSSLDAAEADYNKANIQKPSLDLSIRILLGKGDLEQRRGNFTHALDIYRRALDLIKGELVLERVTIWRKIATVYMSLGHISQAMVALKRCDELLVSLPLNGNVAATWLKVYGTRGLLQYLVGRLNDSIAEFTKGEELARQYHISPLDCMVLNNIASVYTAKGEAGKALELMLRTIELAETAGLLFDLAGNLINLGTLYCSLGMYDKAQREIKRAIDLNKALGNKIGIAHATLSLAIIYHDINDRRAAEAHLQNAITLYNTLGDRFHNITSRLYLIRWYLEWERLEEAVLIFEKLPLLAQEEEILLFSYHIAIGNILTYKAFKEEDPQAKAAILDTARSSFYRARWRASEQKSFMELLMVHISLVMLELARNSAGQAHRHIMVVRAMFKIISDSLADTEMRNALANSWNFHELQKLENKVLLMQQGEV
jgi:tetratricopeptide (TPR) repeat protein